jgi:hypothetical protein
LLFKCISYRYAADDAWRRMRAAVARSRQQHRREGGAVLDAFVASDNTRSGKCSPTQFKAAWGMLGVRISDDEAASIFAKAGGSCTSRIHFTNVAC